MSSPATGPTGPSPQPGGISKGAQIAVGAVLVAVLLGWYGYSNLGDGASFQYYQTLAELREAGTPAGQSMRVHGYVADHSIERNLASKEVRFAVQNDPPHAVGAVGTTLTVVYPSLETPDLFRDGAEVVVEGRIEGRGEDAVLVAKNVLAKCPSKFEAKMDSEPL
jgi:cytochrome c-type biogenesis protein CcmE